MTVDEAKICIVFGQVRFDCLTHAELNELMNISSVKSNCKNLSKDQMRKRQFSLDDFIFEIDAKPRQLTASTTANALTNHVLTQNRFLGSGTFSRVYEIDTERVVKFSWDWDTLVLLKRLGDNSPFFPKVHEIFNGIQAMDERERKYFAAVVERLYIATPKWVFDMVGFYRRPWPAVSSMQSMMRLLALKHAILTATIQVDEQFRIGLAEAIGMLAEECRDHDVVADLRADANVMTRADGHVVISDPAHPRRCMPDDY